MKNSPGGIIAETIQIVDKVVLDIGSGEGEVAREMACLGAHVIGLEPNQKQIAKALSMKATCNETYIKALGEELPFQGIYFDSVIFHNSLHHIPIRYQDRAIKEATRVIKSGGYIFIAEPLAEGPAYELSKVFNDETEIRAAAYQAIKRSKVKKIKEFKYIKTNIYKNLSAYKERSIRRDSKRRSKFEANEEELQNIFNSSSIKTNKGFLFEQPIRVNLLQKK